MRALIFIGELGLIGLAAEIIAVTVLVAWDRILSALSGDRA